MPDAGQNLDDLFNLRASFPDETEKKAFFEAARRNDIRTLEKIIDRWPDAPTKWYDDKKPVLITLYNSGNAETVNFLVKKGADLEQTESDGNWTPLILAAFIGKAQDVEKFLRAGAKVDGKDKCGRTALSMAVDKNNLVVADMLVLCGADADIVTASYKKTTIMQDAKTDEMRDVLKSARARREAFLKGQKVKAPGPAEPAPVEPPAPESDEIKLLNRIVLRKDGDEAPAPKTETPAPAKRGWLKKLGL
jgi:ankyrin repeat protein